MAICKRRREQELETIKVEDQLKSSEDPEVVCKEDKDQTSYFQKTGGVQHPIKEPTDVKKNMLEIEVIENPNSTKEEVDKYLMIARLQEQEEHQIDDIEGEVSNHHSGQAKMLQLKQKQH